jgi:uncharacterized protein (UPF0335 family)
MTKAPSKTLLEANAETGKFYLEAVLNRIKTLESENDKLATAIKCFYDAVSSTVGKDIMGLIAEKMEKGHWWDRQSLKVVQEAAKNKE